MIGDCSCNSVDEIGVVFMKGQEADHGPQEILDVLGLGLHTSPSIGFLAFGEALSGSLDFEFGTDAVDCRCWCPYASGEDLPTFLLLNQPMIASFFDPPCQGGVPRRKKNPAFGNRQNLAVGRSDGVLGGAR